MKKKKYFLYGALGAFVIGAALLLLGIYKNNDTATRIKTLAETGSYYSGTVWIVIGAILFGIGASILIFKLFRFVHALQDR